jgi:hypothetical protein
MSSVCGFSYKPEAGRVVADEPSVDDLQGHRALQMDIKGFVGGCHCPVAKLDRRSVFILENPVVFKTTL